MKHCLVLYPWIHGPQLYDKILLLIWGLNLLDDWMINCHIHFVAPHGFSPPIGSCKLMEGYLASLGMEMVFEIMLEFLKPMLSTSRCDASDNK